MFEAGLLAFHDVRNKRGMAPERPTGLSGSAFASSGIPGYPPSFNLWHPWLSYWLFLSLSSPFWGLISKAMIMFVFPTAMLMIVDRHSLRQLGRCVSVQTNRRSCRLVDCRWPNNADTGVKIHSGLPRRVTRPTGRKPSPFIAR